MNDQHTKTTPESHDVTYVNEHPEKPAGFHWIITDNGKVIAAVKADEHDARNDDDVFTMAMALQALREGRTYKLYHEQGEELVRDIGRMWELTTRVLFSAQGLTSHSPHIPPLNKKLIKAVEKIAQDTEQGTNPMSIYDEATILEG